MTSSAIVLPILFILAAALPFYYYLRHRLRSLPLHLSAAEVSLQSSHSSFRQVSPVPPPSSSGGLLLPRFKFSDVMHPGAVTVTRDCAICLSKFESDHHLRLLPLCLHVDCIDTWLAGQSQIYPVCCAEVFRSDSDLLSRDRPASSSSRVHSIRGDVLEYVVDEEWELQLRDAVLPGHGGGEEDEIIDVVIGEHRLGIGHQRRWSGNRPPEAVFADVRSIWVWFLPIQDGGLWPHEIRFWA